MEHPKSQASAQPSSKDTVDEKVENVSAGANPKNTKRPPRSGNGGGSSEGHSEPPSESLNKTPTAAPSEPANTGPTAIERQAAAALLRSGYGNPTYHEAVARAAGRRESHADRRRPPPSRSGLVSFLLLLLVAAGVALVYTSDFGRPLRKAASEAWTAAEPTIAQHNSSTAVPTPATSSSVTSPPVTPLPATPSPTIDASPVTAPPPAVAPETAIVSKAAIPQTVAESPTAASKDIPEVATPGAISVAIADVSLQTRPELFEQLAQVYKSKLAGAPNDLEALAALNRLQERGLSELETMVTAGDHSTIGRSLDLISRVFPEVVDTARYKYLAARKGYTPSGAKEKSASAVPVKSASIPSDSSAETANNSTKNVSSTKSKIHVVSITPGAMVENQFSPRYDGNVFKVEISYRNLGSAQDESETTLVARLGVPGDPMVLAETPIELLGGKGTKSFLMESLRPGNIGERYQLNFLLNDEYFASSAVRLSMPAQ